MQDLADGAEGQNGDVIGRIVFEVGSMDFPVAKAGLFDDCAACTGHLSSMQAPDACP